MKVCLVGHHVNNPDEGVRNVTFHLYRELAKHHRVIAINANNMKEWLRVSTCRPDIIHFVLGPSSFLSFVIVKLLNLLYRPAKTIMFAIQPFYPRFTKWMAWLGPDVMLVQSHAAERMFSDAGCKVVFLPGGVDIHKFAPISTCRKIALREKYHVPDDKFVILHVGAINEGRNVQLLGSLQGEERQVIVIGRPSEEADLDVLEQLRQCKCLVWTDYFPALEEVYGLSDCYVFPCTSQYNSIEFPLSVLEAMSCNLPVVTRRFGALPDILIPGDGLVFAEDEKTFIRKVCEFSKEMPAVATRQQALVHSWDRVVKRVEAIYAELLS